MANLALIMSGTETRYLHYLEIVSESSLAVRIIYLRIT
jgi:hypothetical protein